MAPISLTYLGEKVEFVDKIVFPFLQSTRPLDRSDSTSLKVSYK